MVMRISEGLAAARYVVEEWLDKQAAGEALTISLDDLERDLIADGLSPS